MIGSSEPLFSGLIDCHAHLEEIDPLLPALERAAAAGVATVIAAAVDAASARLALRLSERELPVAVLPCAGLHPTEIVPGELEAVAALIGENHSRLAAVGEIGLDYWRAKKDERKKGEQRRIFRFQLELARNFGLTAVIHSRGAWDDCRRLVGESGLQPVLFHWYSGPLDVLELILADGHYLSAAPAAAGSPPHRAALAAAPLSRIVVETDSPVPLKRGEERVPTEPADLPVSLRALAEIKNCRPEEAAASSTAAARRLFRFPTAQDR